MKSSRKPEASGASAGLETLGLQLVDAAWAAGTSKVLSLGDFVRRWDNSIVFDAAELARLAAKEWGASRTQTWCFWRSESGHIVTLYAQNSGPAFGAGPIYLPTLPDRPPSHRDLLQASFARQQASMSARAQALHAELLRVAESSGTEPSWRESELLRIGHALFEESLASYPEDAQPALRAARAVVLEGQKSEPQTRHEILQRASIVKAGSEVVAAARGLATILYGSRLER